MNVLNARDKNLIMIITKTIFLAGGCFPLESVWKGQKSQVDVEVNEKHERDDDSHWCYDK